MKVFIAEHLEYVRERLVNIVSEIKGIEIIGQAQKSIEATNSILKLKPDLVILDLQMPEGDAIDVIRKITKGRLAPIVIVLTDYPFLQYQRICTDVGADFFFDKSIEVEKITQVLKKLIYNSPYW